MVLRALIVAGAVSIGALFLAKKGKKGGKVGRDGRPSRASGKRCDPLGAFVDLTPVPPTPAKADGKPRQRPLEGMKFVVKDIFDIEGRVTGFGSPAWVATHDRAAVTARAVSQCADAGAAGVGVTHMDEFAYSINGENAHYGTPVNPAARGRIPGGSSSGSAVAVAACLRGVDFALGTDSGGGACESPRLSPDATASAPPTARFPPRVSHRSPHQWTPWDGSRAIPPCCARLVASFSPARAERWNLRCPSRFSW